MEQGYQEETSGDVLSAAFESGVVSPEELAGDLGAAGVSVPEKAEKAPAEEGVSGVDQVEQGYQEEASGDVLSAAFESGVVSPEELAGDLGAAGVSVPEKAEKAPAEPGLTGVEQVEQGYAADTPADILAAASQGIGVSRQEMQDSLKAVGVNVPDRPAGEQGPTGVDEVADGFTAAPEMNSVEELQAIKYAAAPEEVDEGIEKVATEYQGERVPLNELLLEKLQAGGYQGDLEDLKKLISEVKGN